MIFESLIKIIFLSKNNLLNIFIYENHLLYIKHKTYKTILN